METCCTPEQLAIIGINPSDITLAFVTGFGAIFISWAFGFVTRAAIEAIRTI